MSDSLLTNLGLYGSSPTAPNYSAQFLIFAFVWTNALSSTRGMKARMKMTNQGSPREDVIKYGEAAVKSGKITLAQLDRLKRAEAAHSNAIEAFPFFVGALLLANLAHVPNWQINRTALLWCAVRVLYHGLYLGLTRGAVTYTRALAWWSGNIILFRLVWACRAGLNGN